MIDRIESAARSIAAVPRLLRPRIGADRAREALGERIAGREAALVDVVRRGIYGRPSSPYRALLRAAGCELGDVEALVAGRGVEGALHELFRHGVYLTVDEFKGRRPVVRGAITVDAGPAALVNHDAARHVSLQSSGSRGQRTGVWLDARFVRERAEDVGLTFVARGAAGAEHGLWLVPSSAAIVHAFEFEAFGTPQRRWFSQLDPDSPALSARYRWGERLLSAAALAVGARIPRPLHVSLEDPLPIARWMSETLRTGRRPNLWTYASSAVRLCRAAADAGLEMPGARFSVGGEPFTEARQATVRSVGAEAYPQYGIAECGEVAFACLAPRRRDEMHVFHDLHALIQPGDEGPARGVAADALLISSLRSSAPFVLLNVSMGDRGVLDRRACGCPMAETGWLHQVHSLRSDEKLTAAGMTFHDADVVRVLEETLVARFGGGPTDYQLVEEEDADGRARLRLLVHPRVPGFDARAIADTFLAGIGAGPGGEARMALVWRGAGLLVVERQAPVATASGKLLHLLASPRP